MSIVALTMLAPALNRILQYVVDGTSERQQKLLARIRSEEAQRAAQANREGRRYEAELRAAEAAAAFERQIKLAEMQAHLQVMTQAQLAQLKRTIDNGPFKEEDGPVRDLAGQMCDGGRRPLLLVAPMQADDRTARPGPDLPALGSSRRYRWQAMPWSGDAALGEGLIRRPLVYADADVTVIQQVLADLPVILLHGDHQGPRVRPEITAWNLAPDRALPPVHLMLPEMRLPATNPSVPRQSEEDRLTFEDRLADHCVWAATALTDWFHATHRDRPPQLHLRIDEGTPERSLAAISGANVLGLVSASGPSRARAAVRRVIVLIEGDLVPEADQAFLAALPSLRATAVQLRGSEGRAFTKVLDDLLRTIDGRAAPLDHVRSEAVKLRVESGLGWM